MANIRRNGPDIVLTYRSDKRIKQLVLKSAGRLKVVDENITYCRLQAGEDAPERLFAVLKGLMGGE